MGLVSELRRRNVFRMVVLYAVAAWLIMQVAGVLIDLAKLPDWIGLTTLWLLAVGFPISLVFSWFYEITPEGISLEKDVDRATSITHVTGRRLDFLVISLLAAAVILFAYDKWWISPPPEQSIAVLAFENMSADAEQEYFSDGISEELLNLLAQVPGLKVISRSSAFSFKGKDVAIPTIAEQLNVAHILEGSVRRMGNRLRITAQLIEAKSDTHLWSETYDRELESTFAVQDEIAAAVVEAIKGRLELSGAPPPRADAAANPEAHDAYLRGRYLIVQRTRAGVKGAGREFEKAIALDPGYALAYAELAIALSLGSSGLDYTERVAAMTSHVEQAMSLDPDLAEAYAAKGRLLLAQDHYEDALQQFEQAIHINPNYSTVYSWMGLIYQGLGRYEESFTMLEMAVRLDPLSVLGLNNYTFRLIERNRLAEAERELAKLQVVSPLWAARARGGLASVGGKWADLVLGDLDALRIEPDNTVVRRYMLADIALLGLEKEALAIRAGPWLLSVLGRTAAAVELAEARFAENPAQPYNRYMLGQTLAMAGDYARARPMQEAVWKKEGGRVARLGAIEAIDAAALVAIRRSAGDEEGALEVVKAIRDNVRRYREAGIVNGEVQPVRNRPDFEDGLASFLAGEREEGLALIAKAVEDGDFIWPNLAYLQVLYDDPGFALIRQMLNARQVRERNRFLTIVCNDNPYAAVWQPEEGTCEEFSAAGGNLLIGTSAIGR